MTDHRRLRSFTRRSALKTVGLGAALAGTGTFLSARSALAQAPEIKTLEKGFITASLYRRHASHR